MRILIDIGHPAHVHLFKNLYFKLSENDHDVWVTIKKVPIVMELLEKYGIPFTVLGTKSDSISGKLFDQIRFNYKILKLVNRFGIDYGIGTSINIAHVSKISALTSFVVDDDDRAVQPLMSKFGHPFADFLVRPSVLAFERKKINHINYPGYHELAYLHPKVFKPDKNILKDIGVKEGEKFFILRFNAFKAHHDVGVSGLSIDQKRYLVDRLRKEGKVFITTERNIDKEFLPYQLLISPEKAHSLLFYATLLIGDSQTMSSEAAVLGTPSLRCNSFAGRISYLEEEEKKYGLTYGFMPSQFEQMLDKLEELLGKKELDKEWKKKREIMLGDKINVTEFIYDLINHYHLNRKIDKSKINYDEYK